MQRSSHRQTSGFTLVELMITVAIIGILAATAITMFRAQQFRSKRTEGMTNLEALAKMARGYFGDVGAYPIVAGAWPAAAPQTNPIPWDVASNAQFGVMGFKIDGGVRYAYDFDAAGECPCASAACFTAVAFSDLDGDALFGGIGYFHRDAGGVECPTAIFGWTAPLDSGGNPQYDASTAFPRIGGALSPDDY